MLSILQQKTAFEHVSAEASVPIKPTGSMLGRNADVDQLADRLSRSSLVVGSLPAGNAFAKQMIPAGGAVPSHASTSGLAAALRSGNKPPVAGQAGVGGALGGSAYAGVQHSQDPEPLVGSVGRRRAPAGVVLATSFREHMPAPLPVATEDDGEDDDSEDEGLRQARRRVEGRNAAAGTTNVPAGQTYPEDDDDDDDEAEAAALNRRRAGSDSRDDGVFESDL